MKRKSEKGKKAVERMKQTIWVGLPSFTLVFLAMIAFTLGIPVSWIIMGVVSWSLYMDFQHVLNRTLEPDPWRVLKNSAWLVLFIHAVAWLSHYLGGYGLLGFILLGLILSGYVLYRNWRAYKESLEYIEREYLYGGKTITEVRRKKK